ncbi:Fic family protein [Ornithinimicrobium sp. LYQ92]|uniref:Fic family protein n=1 Tax=Serinicoccus sp. LYQ92 TaxID=3378798 RepID=UPI0038549110
MQGYTRHPGGVLREEPVWIGGFASTPVGAHHVAPHHTHLMPLLDDLTAFARRSDLPRMTQIAVTHAQFETIHPFTDGNGRTGRALVHVMVRENRLVQHGLLPVSAGN